MPTTVTDLERAILCLYSKQTIHNELDGGQLRQFLAEDDALAVEATSLSDALAIIDENTSTDLTTRRDRYVGVLGYILASRCTPEAAEQVVYDAGIATLGAKLIDHFPDTDGAAHADDLASAFGRLDQKSEVVADALNDLQAAFDPALAATESGGTYHLLGAAAEMAEMFIELATTTASCTARTGRLTINGKDHDVTVLEGETCSHVPFERAKGGVDPRNWPTYNPALFHRMDVVPGHFTKSPTSNSWAGIVQERVGALSGPVVTNLTVTYHEEPGLAVTAYDLTDPAVSGVPADDGKVTVDYGMLALYQEGDHVRMRVLKVVAFAATSPPVTPPTSWLCPLWLIQTLFAGWWSGSA